jgi:hypothetical protein
MKVIPYASAIGSIMCAIISIDYQVCGLFVKLFVNYEVILYDP